MSVFLRRYQLHKKAKQNVRQAQEWSAFIQSLAPSVHASKKGGLVVMRLDDIGDFILSICAIKILAQQLKQLQPTLPITFIGNIIWKDLYHSFCPELTDHCIWVDKHAYHRDEMYRQGIWQQVRALECTTVLALSRTRPLLLDDLITQAANAPASFGSTNNHSLKAANLWSNQNYTQCYAAPDCQHDWQYNQTMVSWFLQQFTGLSATNSEHLNEPLISHPKESKMIACCIGASAKSKRWPNEHWIDFIQQLQRNAYKPILIGGPSDKTNAANIVAATGVDQYVGERSLMESIALISQAVCVISGDSMAAHVGALNHQATVILANGVNATRFTDYSNTPYTGHVKTLFTTHYQKWLRQHNPCVETYEAVSSADMRTIHPKQVYDTPIPKKGCLNRQPFFKNHVLTHLLTNNHYLTIAKFSITTLYFILISTCCDTLKRPCVSHLFVVYSDLFYQYTSNIINAY
jgi:ADP-heptose:LPS heptosyltransferase